MGRPKVAFVDNPIFDNDVSRRSADQGRVGLAQAKQLGPLSSQTHIVTVHEQQAEDDEIVQVSLEPTTLEEVTKTCLLFSCVQGQMNSNSLAHITAGDVPQAAAAASAYEMGVLGS